MHFKNGREAREGDLVIGKSQYSPTVTVGIMVDINPGCTSCNASIIRPGGIIQTCVTVGEYFHAEDAFACISADTGSFKPALEPATATMNTIRF